MKKEDFKFGMFVTFKDRIGSYNAPLPKHKVIGIVTKCSNYLMIDILNFQECFRKHWHDGDGDIGYCFSPDNYDCIIPLIMTEEE